MKLPLDVFPHQALNNSILTPILIGLGLMVLFNEGFGWVLAGYLVPGYMAVILLSFPVSALVITMEAIITHILVKGISDFFSSTFTWSRFFGRERFLLYVVVSVIVRLIMEVLVFPGIDPLLIHLGIKALHDQFFSIGLVLVPLLANSFWKIGLSRGLIEKGVLIGLTYLILTKLIIPYTNLDLGTFSLTYEHLALKFTVSPKVYILLLTGAIISAAFNIIFGWDFNGIMIPTLMAIALFTPVKYLSTFVEATLAVLVFNILQHLPLINKITLERGRMLFVVFLITFTIKWVFAANFPSYPGLKATDFFGFGYVLPALIATKIIQKHGFLKILLPIMITSVTVFVVGSTIGYALNTLHEGNKQAFSPVSEQTTYHSKSMIQTLITSQVYVSPWPTLVPQTIDMDLRKNIATTLANIIDSMPKDITCKGIKEIFNNETLLYTLFGTVS